MILVCQRKALAWGLILFLVFSASAQAAERFSFVALGDMPYGAPVLTGPPYERLIDAINRAAPAFSIHVGDIKSGSTPCSDEEFRRQRAYFDSFKSALIYTPGDNEWTDCHREKAGKYDPLGRLNMLREIFYDTGPESLGARPLMLDRQPNHGPEEFSDYVENQRWIYEGILFMTAHIVGSNNGFQTQRPAVVKEYYVRSRANSAWIEDGFRIAAETGASAIVLAIHADVFEGRSQWTDWPENSGFTETMRVFRKLAEAYRKPVLLIHGDSHVFRIDQPFTSANPDRKNQVLDNVTRLEVFGAPDVHAVRITVDLERPEIFGFAPLFGPGNRVFSDD